MTGTYATYRTLDVTVPANDWSDTITMSHGEGVAAIRFPTGWTLGSLYWAISPDGGITFVQAYQTTNPLKFHGDAVANTVHDNLFSAIGQWDRILRIKPSVAQTGPMVVTLFIMPFKHYHSLGRGHQPRLPMYRVIPDDVNPKRNARDDEATLGGGVA